MEEFLKAVFSIYASIGFFISSWRVYVFNVSVSKDSEAL